MLKTNSKQVKEKIRKWISDNFDASSYDREELNNSDIEKQIQFIAYICWVELGHEVKRLGYTFQEMFINWCSGLPSLLNTASYYCYNSAVALVGDILEQTKEERSKYDETDAERLMSYMIYKEVASDLFRVAC